MQTNPESAAVEAVAWQRREHSHGEWGFIPKWSYDKAMSAKQKYPSSAHYDLRELVPQSALDALRGEVERLEKLCLALEAQAEENFSKYAESNCRVAELRAALRPLADATFAEFCDESTEEMEPDDAKVRYPEDTCEITFGMIRNARAALTKESP